MHKTADEAKFVAADLTPADIKMQWAGGTSRERLSFRPSVTIWSRRAVHL